MQQPENLNRHFFQQRRRGVDASESLSSYQQAEAKFWGQADRADQVRA